jgi:hypothetical protein
MPIHGYPGGVITANPVAPTSTVATGVWTSEQQLQAVSQGNWPFTIPTQQISRSLRFNGADDAYVSRTFSTPTNNKKWSYSVWMKRSAFAANQAIMSSNVDGAEYWDMRFNTSDQILVQNRVGSSNLLLANTTAVYRDPSAWYHIVFVFDSDNATAAFRNRLYVNNVEYTLSANSGSGNASAWNVNAVQHNIGVSRTLTSGGGIWAEFNGYEAEINFVDGQALTPSSFGQINASTGVWEPINYTGTYGTNGFELSFADNSGTTSTTLGADTSGNGNNWTPNNFSVTAGAGNDSLVDSPTSYGTDTGAGGTVRGNYATWNPLATTPAAPVTFSNGNLDVSFGSSLTGWVKSSIAVSSGKWYVEITVTAASDANMIVGIVKPETYIAPGDTADSYGYLGDGRKYTNGTGSSYGASWTTNDVIGVALDMDAGSIVFYKNGASQGTAFTGISGTYVIEFADTSNVGTRSIVANFGQRAFAYTAPSGFKALCTQNLPTPTIGATSTTQADNYFGVALYSGTGSGNSNVVSGLEFTTDFWWQKARNASTNHYLQDAVRGFGASKSLSSNTTGSEGFNGTPLTQSLSVSSTGFTVSGSDFNGNTASETYVAWCWNAGGSTVTNTSGTISAQVRANTTSGFSIVTYTGNGSANQTVGHGLGVAPAFGILKDRDPNSNNSQWQVFHTAAGDKYAYLSTTAAFAGTAEYYPTTGSSTTVTVARTGGVIATTNESGDRFVMYLFTPVAGYSAFGSYVGNGSSTDGPFVYTGFRPRFFLIKDTTSANDWLIYDTARNPYNLAGLELFPNSSAAEATGNRFDILSNGFKSRGSGGAHNTNGNTYIYAAFAEFPFKTALAR